jgi:hypothetical protein
MPRGQTQRVKDFIALCAEILEEIHPASVRAVAYQLFNRKIIESMAKKCTNRVSEHLVTARKAGIVPWAWIVDESREAEYAGTWSDVDSYVNTMLSYYRKDRWTQQPHRVEVWSEKGTVRGTLAPVLRKYGVIFRNMHGFTSWTVSHDAARECRQDPRPTTILYVGDYDPSGMYMSEVDLPENRFAWEGVPVAIRRLAIYEEPAREARLLSFPVADKAHDKRYPWWKAMGYGDTCWELDAMNPNDLRGVVAAAIEEYIDWDAWLRCDAVEAAENTSMRQLLQTWKATKAGHASS